MRGYQMPPRTEVDDVAEQKENITVVNTQLFRKTEIPDPTPDILSEVGVDTTQSALNTVFAELAKQKKSRLSLYIFSKYVYKTIQSIYHTLSQVSLVCLNMLIKYIDFVYKTVSTPFICALVPVYLLIQKINNTSIGFHAHQLYIWIIGGIKKTCIKIYIPQKIQKAKPAEKKSVQNKPMSLQAIATSAKALFSEQKNIQQNHLHFYLEAFLSVFVVLVTAAVFISGIPSTAPHLFLLYMLALLICGSYMLSIHRSPRIFWTIGVLAWSALAYWYFSVDNTELYIGSVVLFLSAFLSLYAISSFIWYGIQEEKYTILEQGLFALHPFLYVSGIYLLLIADFKYLVVLLYIAVLSLYVYFAQTLRQKKGLHVCTTVCYFVALIAGLSAISIVFDGFYRISALAILLCIYIYKREKKKLLFIVPVLLYIFGYVLYAPAPAIFFPIANERFASYILGAITFFVLWTDTIKSAYTKVLSGWYENSLFAGFVLIVSTGVFVELQDIQNQTTLLPGRSGEIVLVGILLLASILFYFIGIEKRNKFISLVSITSALSAIFLTVTKLIN
jgi:hypothetical protein